MSGVRILSDQQIDEMADLHERGRSYRQIVNHFRAAGVHISAGAIMWQCLRVGADIPPKQRKRFGPGRPIPCIGRGRTFTEAEDLAILRMESEGLRRSEIARRLGRAPNSVLGRQLTLARHAARAEAAV